MDIKPFLKSLFEETSAELHSTTVEELQKEIAEDFLTYFGQFKNGEVFILEDKHLSRLSPYELSEELPFTEQEVEEYLTFTKSIKLNTELQYNLINITPDKDWLIGGIRSVLADFLKGKVSCFTFPVHISFTPSIGLSYDLSVTLMNTQADGKVLSVKPSSIISIEEKKYSGYYASEDGSMDAEVVINKFNLNFNRGNVIKYCIRAGKKDPSREIEDLEKAKRYIEIEISRLLELQGE